MYTLGFCWHVLDTKQSPSSRTASEVSADRLCSHFVTVYVSSASRWKCCLYSHVKNINPMCFLAF